MTRKSLKKVLNKLNSTENLYSNFFDTKSIILTQKSINRLTTLDGKGFLKKLPPNIECKVPTKYGGTTKTSRVQSTLPRTLIENCSFRRGSSYPFNAILELG